MPRPLIVALSAAALFAMPASAQTEAQTDTDQTDTAQTERPAPDQGQSATADFLDRSGAKTGAAVLTSAPGGVLITVRAVGLVPQSWVGFHIHENGKCDPVDRYESAGGHFNPNGSEHGYFRDGGPHAGDMPNLWVDDSGTINAQTFNPYVQLNEGENQIRGRALMLHLSADDYETASSGGAGERLACAVIE